MNGTPAGSLPGSTPGNPPGNPTAHPAGDLSGLDRILLVKPGERAVALRNVPHTLDIFDSHFPRKPVLPGVLVLGSLARLAGLLLAEQTGRTWRLAGAERVRYRHFIQPGDQMEIEVDIREQDERRAVLSGAVRVEGRLVTSVRALRMDPVPPAGDAAAGESS
jgi:3-hydroxyacyl-[acyl-carrier-protein] dehydratase